MTEWILIGELADYCFTTTGNGTSYNICTITSIAASIGVPRIVPRIGIPYPGGNPSIDMGAEKKLRKKLALEALHALCHTVNSTTES